MRAQTIGDYGYAVLSHAVLLTQFTDASRFWDLAKDIATERWASAQHAAAQLPADFIIAIIAMATASGLLNLVLITMWLRTKKHVPPVANPCDMSVAIVPDGPNLTEEDHPDSKLVGVPIQTLIGEIAFRNKHDVGRLGDYLSALYFTKHGYTKKKSKTSKVHGIDGVYVRYASGNKKQLEVLVIENKINSSGYKPHQLSVEYIRSQCHKMLKSVNAEVQETAELILRAMSDESDDRLIRQLVRHDLRIGKSSRFSVDREGNTADFHETWKNEHQMRRVLTRARDKNRILNAGSAIPSKPRS